MAGKNLVQLMHELKAINSDVRKIGLDFSDQGLRIYLNLRTGTDGYEEAIANPQGGTFDISYRTFPQVAFETFLDRKYARQIDGSGVLTRLRAEIEQTKKDGEKPAPVKEGSETYSPLVWITHGNCNFQDVENAFYFFSRVFRNKARPAQE